MKLKLKKTKLFFQCMIVIFIGLTVSGYCTKIPYIIAILGCFGWLIAYDMSSVIERMVNGVLTITDELKKALEEELKKADNKGE